jgi:hypothetical protein
LAHARPLGFARERDAGSEHIDAERPETANEHSISYGARGCGGPVELNASLDQPVERAVERVGLDDTLTSTSTVARGTAQSP